MANKVLLENHQFTTTLLQINELIAVYGSPIAPAPFSLIIGEQYTVVWDGVEYECTAYDGGAMMTGMVYIGNGSGFNMPGDASQPFVIAEADGTVVVMSLLDTAANTASSHTVSIAYEDVQYAIYRSTLTAIAKSIRDKTGTTEKLSPTAMPTAIEGISGGGGGSTEGCVTVTFMNGDAVLFTRPVYIGDDCPDPITQGHISTPTKESTAQYDYTYSGWSATDGGSANSSVLNNITEAKTVFAAYSSKLRYYTVTFYDEDGTTELATYENVAYGSMPSTVYTPIKADHVFTGWTPNTGVTGDMSYVAGWKLGLDFTNMSWAEIDSAIKAGKAELFAIGARKTFTCRYPTGNTFVQTVCIAGINHDDLADGSGKAGLTLYAWDYGGIKSSWAGYYDNGIPWCGTDTKSTAIKDALDDWYSYFPAEVQSLVKSVNKTHYDTQTSQYATVTAKLFPPAVVEAMPNATVRTGEGSLYPYLETNGPSNAWTRTRYNNTRNVYYFENGELKNGSQSQDLARLYCLFCI